MQNIVIRAMCVHDIDVAAQKYPPWSSFQEVHDRWSKYFQQQQQNIRTVAVIERDKELLGYGSLLLQSEYPRFSNIPEINDVWIYDQHRSRGLGTQLITWLEKLAVEKGYSEIGIGVGLYADYGRAQQLYIRLGYTPDGHGITYKGKPVVPGNSYPVDDDLILWLTKSLLPR